MRPRLIGSQRGSGYVGSFRLRIIDLLEVDHDGDTTVTIPEVPQRRL